MFYIIERKYVGVDKDRLTDANTINISPIPACNKRTGEIRINGCCGTTNNWATHAHGKHKTVEHALEAIKEKFGDNSRTNIYAYNDDDTIQLFRPSEISPKGKTWLKKVWWWFTHSRIVQQHNQQPCRIR